MNHQNKDSQKINRKRRIIIIFFFVCVMAFVEAQTRAHLRINESANEITKRETEKKESYFKRDYYLAQVINPF